MREASSNPLLQLQREDLITVLESAVDLIGIADAEGRTLYVNPAMKRVMGFGETEDLSGKIISDYHPPEAAKTLLEEAFPIALRDSIWIGETLLCTRDGQEIPTSQVIMTHKNPDGSLRFVSSMMRDITEQKAVEDQLRRSNALLKAQQEASIDGILVADEHRRIVDYNQQFCEIWNLPKTLSFENSRQLAETVAEQVEDSEAFLAGVEALYQNLDTVFHDELGLRDGRTIERHSKAVKSPSGEYYGRITFFRDISERKRTEAALQQSEQQFRNIVENANDIIFVNTPEGIFSYVSPNVINVMGYASEEMIGKPFSQFLHPDDAERCLNLNQLSVETREPYSGIECRSRYKDGSFRWQVVNISTAFGVNGELQIIGVARDIHDRKVAEEALQRSEARYRAFITATAQAVWMTNAQGEVVEDIPLWCALTGRSEASAKGWGWLESIHPDDREATAQVWVEAVNSGKIYEVEQRLQVASGEYRLFAVRGVPIFDHQGRIQEWIGTKTDITEQKQAEETLRQQNALLQSQQQALQEKEAQYRTIFEAITDGLFITDVETTNVVEANPAASQMHGYSQEEFLALHPTAYIHPDSLPVFQNFIEMMRAGKPFYSQAIDVCKDGRLIDVEVTGTICSYKGKPHGLAIVRDISERVRVENERQAAEAALRRSELKYRHLFENSQVGIGRTRIEDGLFLDANQRCADILHFSAPNELIGKRFAKDFYANPQGRQFMLDDLQKNGTVRDLEVELRRADGSIGWGLFSLRPSLEEACFEFVIVDISERVRVENERKIAEEALQRRAEFDHLLSYISRQLIDQDAETAIHIALEAIVRHIGAERGAIFEYDADHTRCQLVYEWCGENIVPLTPEARGSNVSEYPLLHQQFLSGQALHTADVQTIPEGPERQLFVRQSVQSVLGVPAIYQGKVTGFIGIDVVHFQKAWSQEDINSLKRFSDLIAIGRARQKAEADLRIAKEAAEAANLAKSTFLANMSHELRTPLNAILGFSQLMERDVTLSDRQRDSLAIINRSGEHLLNLINDVLEMSKIEAGRTTLNLVPFDLHYLLQTLQEMFLIRAKAKQLVLNFAIAPNLPQHIETDENKLRQVLINLLSNAIKFTEHGSITLQASVSDSLPLTLQFKVQDAGQGIAPEELENLFRPFIQTSSGSQLQEGTGLGLTISRRFVRLLGGDMQVESVLGQGSTFSFEIPVAIADSIEVAPLFMQRRVLRLAPNQRRYRILVVDDRAENRDFVEQLLTVVGFATRSAIDGRDAIAQWQQWQPHLILMDMRMPVMDGYEAARQIRTLESNQPCTKILALTASAFEEQRASILAAGCDDLLAKPFRESHLFKKLAEHLGVNYLYEANAEQPTEVSLLTRSMLETMPETWIAELHQAALAIDAERILRLIEQIPDSQQALADALTEFIQQYYFDEIIELSQSAANSSQSLLDEA